jgi:multisubunit Na+/H+ antiporter MnhE subunit
VSTPLAGEPRPRRYRTPLARRIGAWLTWWVLLMSFWVMIDDSLQTDELLAGAGAAAIAATLAEVVSYQAATRFRMRIEWLVPAARLPASVARDTWTVFAALARKLIRNEDPPSRFTTQPFRFGADTPEGVTRRFLVTGARSLAPNSFVAGLDKDENTMLVHELVPPGGKR